jgi:hypothetical protein
VQLTQGGVETLADDLVVADDHRTDHRIWADPPATTFRELERPAQVGCVLFGADRGQPRLLYDKGLRLIDWSVSQ